MAAATAVANRHISQLILVITLLNFHVDYSASGQIQLAATGDSVELGTCADRQFDVDPLTKLIVVEMGLIKETPLDDTFVSGGLMRIKNLKLSLQTTGATQSAYGKHSLNQADIEVRVRYKLSADLVYFRQCPANDAEAERSDDDNPLCLNATDPAAVSDKWSLEEAGSVAISCADGRTVYEKVKSCRFSSLEHPARSLIGTRLRDCVRWPDTNDIRDGFNRVAAPPINAAIERAQKQRALMTLNPIDRKQQIVNDTSYQPYLSPEPKNRTARPPEYARDVFVTQQIYDGFAKMQNVPVANLAIPGVIELSRVRLSFGNLHWTDGVYFQWFSTVQLYPHYALSATLRYGGGSGDRSSDTSSQSNKEIAWDEIDKTTLILRRSSNVAKKAQLLHFSFTQILRDDILNVWFSGLADSITCKQRQELQRQIRRAIIEPINVINSINAAIQTWSSSAIGGPKGTTASQNGSSKHAVTQQQAQPGADKKTQAQQSQLPEDFAQSKNTTSTNMSTVNAPDNVSIANGSSPIGAQPASKQGGQLQQFPGIRARGTSSQQETVARRLDQNSQRSTSTAHLSSSSQRQLVVLPSIRQPHQYSFQAMVEHVPRRHKPGLSASDLVLNTTGQAGSRPAGPTATSNAHGSDQNKTEGFGGIQGQQLNARKGKRQSQQKPKNEQDGDRSTNVMAVEEILCSMVQSIRRSVTQYGRRYAKMLFYSATQRGLNANKELTDATLSFNVTKILQRLEPILEVSFTAELRATGQSNVTVAYKQDYLCQIAYNWEGHMTDARFFVTSLILTPLGSPSVVATPPQIGQVSVDSVLAESIFKEKMAALASDSAATTTEARRSGN